MSKSYTVSKHIDSSGYESWNPRDSGITKEVLNHLAWYFPLSRHSALCGLLAMLLPEHARRA